MGRRGEGGWGGATLKRYEWNKKRPTASPLRGYLSIWIGRMVSGRGMAEWTCDGAECQRGGTQPFNENLWSGLIEGLTERL